MDCMTISTFRSLEQQAIRQYRETRSKETNNKFISKETFKQENFAIAKAHRINDEPEVETTTNKGLINYYA